MTDDRLAYDLSEMAELAAGILHHPPGGQLALHMLDCHMVQASELRQEIDDEWVANAVREFNRALADLDLHDVPRTSHPQNITNVFRTDTPQPSLTAEEALSGAPEVERQMFKVPRILTEET